MMRFSMKHALLLTALVLLAGSVHAADELKPFDFAVPPKYDQANATRAECTFPDLTIPENTVVYAAGAYSGREVGFQIDGSGHAATQFDIAINSKQRPVILMLGAYEPTIWNIGWSEGTKIVAVLASGYHRQVVAGLPKSTPVLVSSYDNKGPCGYFYIGKENNAALNPKARALFGRAVELVYPGDKKGRIVVGDPLTNAEKLLTSATTPPESFRDVNAPLAGEAGLEEAVTKGILRRSTQEDRNRWVEQMAIKEVDRDIPPIAGQGRPKPRAPRMFNAFVVLKPFTFPSGLYGGHSASFFLEKGVPFPQGDKGHCTIYDFNTMTCSGPMCEQ